VQHGGVSCAERRGLRRFDTDESDVGIVQEAGEARAGAGRAAIDLTEDAAILTAILWIGFFRYRRQQEIVRFELASAPAT